MADEVGNGAEAATGSPESRLKAAGFVNAVGFWKEPGGERLFNTEDAIAALDAGEYPAVYQTAVAAPPSPGPRTSEVADPTPTVFYRMGGAARRPVEGWG